MVAAKALLFTGCLLLALSLCAQNESTGPEPAPAAKVAQPAEPDEADDYRMSPPRLGMQTAPVTLGSEERSNYLRGGLVFTGAYTDNVAGAEVQGQPEGDWSWSLGPRIEFEKTDARIAADLTYAPGFTFYDRLSARNEQDQNVSMATQYRLTQHITLKLDDVFQKSSNVLNNQAEMGNVIPVIPGTGGANDSVIAPIANIIENFTTAGMDYQFGRNQMIGVNAGFAFMQYPNASQVPGLYNSSSQSASLYYAARVRKKDYLGIGYQYERLVADPTIGQNITQANAIFGFYSVTLTPKLSVSVYGGPQHERTDLPALPSTSSWRPYAGANLSWHSFRTAVSMEYMHQLASSSGLATSVQLDSANFSFKQMLRRRLVATVSAGWSQNDLVAASLVGFTNGHTVYTSFGVQRDLGNHIGATAGYTWFRQDYAIATFAGQPTTNRAFFSVSYQFERALGR